MTEWMHAHVAYAHVLCTIDWLHTDIVVLLLADGMQLHIKQNVNLGNDVLTVACPCGFQVMWTDCMLCTGDLVVRRLHVWYTSGCVGMLVRIVTWVEHLLWRTRSTSPPLEVAVSWPHHLL